MDQVVTLLVLEVPLTAMETVIAVLERVAEVLVVLVLEILPAVMPANHGCIKTAVIPKGIIPQIYPMMTWMMKS